MRSCEFPGNSTPSGGWAGPNLYSVCWAPDGRKLAFNWHKQKRVAHAYVINADGSGMAQVTTEANVFDQSLSWSP